MFLFLGGGGVSASPFSAARSLLFRHVCAVASIICAINCLALTVFLSHRRIDVSTSAFKKHSQLFEAMKSTEEGTYKVTEHFAV